MDFFHGVARLIGPGIGGGVQILRGPGHNLAARITGSELQRLNLEGLGQNDQLIGGLLQGDAPADQAEQILHHHRVEPDGKNAHMRGVKRKAQGLDPVRLVFQADLPAAAAGRIRQLQENRRDGQDSAVADPEGQDQVIPAADRGFRKPAADLHRRGGKQHGQDSAGHDQHNQHRKQ